MSTRGIIEGAGTRETQYQVEQFYYREAEYLDTRQFDAWLSLLDDDLHYWMPVRTARLPREERYEFEGPGGAAHFDDDKAGMAQRVRKLHTGRAWSEVPASRTRHFVSNVIVRPGDATDAYRVSSAFLVYRTRGDRHMDMFAGGRQDVLRAVDTEAGFQITRRKIILDQTVVLANNISTFF